MNVLVDTSIWSLALRRRQARASDETAELVELIREGRVMMLGPIRQELLSGLRSTEQFQRVREHLRAFPDHRLDEDDFEQAAECCNRCVAKGVQGSNTDFLLCAVSRRCEVPIFTADNDFRHFARVLDLALHAPRG